MIFRKTATKTQQKEQANNKDFAKQSKKNTSTQDDEGGEVAGSLLYRIFVRSAYRLLKKPLAVLKLLKATVEHVRRYDSVKALAADVRERLELTMRLIKNYVKGEYTDVSKLKIALSIAALLYFVSPFDLIPDFIAGGLVDDIALLTWVYSNMQDELERYLVWEEETQLVRIEIDQ